MISLLLLSEIKSKFLSIHTFVGPPDMQTLGEANTRDIAILLCICEPFSERSLKSSGILCTYSNSIGVLITQRYALNTTSIDTAVKRMRI